VASTTEFSNEVSTGPVAVPERLGDFLHWAMVDENGAESCEATMEALGRVEEEVTAAAIIHNAPRIVIHLSSETAADSMAKAQL
jgi:hypothetical protein